MPVTLATFSVSSFNLPILVAHPAVINFLQGATLMMAVLLTVLLTQKMSQQSFGELWIQHLMTVGLAICLWQIIV